MKSKQQNPPKSNSRSGVAPTGAGADPNAGDPEDLQAMWSAVAALLDDTTVGAPPVNPASTSSGSVYGNSVTKSAAQATPAAPASIPPKPIPPTSSTPVEWAPASTQNSGSQNSGSQGVSANGADATPAPLPAVPQPIAPQPAPAAKPRWNPLFGSRSNQQPTAPAQPPVGTPPTDSPNFGAPIPDAPATDAPTTDSPVAPKVTNGDMLVPPYAPGAGPQILPAPDGYLNTPPVPPQPQQPTLPRLPGEPFILPEGLDTQSVMIRGRNDGVGIQIGEGAWRDLLYVLSYRIEQTDGFFRGNHIAVDVGGRHLNENDLNQMRHVMRSYGLDPSLLRTSSERTFMAALALGIPVSQVSVDGSPVNEAVPAESESEGLGFFVYRGSLRSGQVLYRREHVIVLGDVNPGAEVVSDGDIMVWGRLRGIAHAGARGNSNSIITALDLDPVQLRIDQVIGAAQAGISSNGPRWGASRSAERKAELARLVDGKLKIMPWDEAKSGGVALLKRKFF